MNTNIFFKSIRLLITWPLTYYLSALLFTKLINELQRNYAWGAMFIYYHLTPSWKIKFAKPKYIPSLRAYWFRMTFNKIKLSADKIIFVTELCALAFVSGAKLILKRLIINTLLCSSIYLKVLADGKEQLSVILFVSVASFEPHIRAKTHLGWITKFCSDSQSIKTRKKSFINKQWIDKCL